MYSKSEDTRQRNTSDNIIALNLTDRHYAKLRNSALDDNDIRDCNFFSGINKAEAKRLTGYSLTGLIIPYFDPLGNPYKRSDGKFFYRIRPDREDDPDADEKPKYLSPKNEGNRPYFPKNYPNWPKALRSAKIPIHITEGEFKAACQAKFGYATIGLTGVHGFVDRSSRVPDLEEVPAQLMEDGGTGYERSEQLDSSRVLPELDDLENGIVWENRKVYLTFDSDIVQKKSVRYALFKLAEWLESKGADPYIVLLPSELNGEKNGVDDLIFRHGREAYELLLWWAQPAITYVKKQKTLNLPPNPPLVQKVDLAQVVLASKWRMRPGIGWHRWTGTHWHLEDSGSGESIHADILRMMRTNGWQMQGQNDKGNIYEHLRYKLVHSRWNPSSKIAFSNGVLDIDSNEFKTTFDPGDYLTYVLPYKFDPNFDCPNWSRFLLDTLGGDPKAVELVQAFFRWAIAPKSATKYDLEVCWDLYGEPGTGKGTTLEILKQLVGIHNCGWFSTKTFNNDNALANLLDKPVSICPDDSGHLDDPGKFNRIISNEPVQIKKLYKDSFSTTLNTFLVRAYNKFITTSSGAQGLDRRIVAMAFKHKPTATDEHLGEKLAAELPGIFNWAYSISLVEAKKRIRWAGDVEAVKEASTERFLFNNPAYEFLLEFYPNGGKVRIRDLHHHYSSWAKEKGDMPVGEKVFKSQILSFGARQLPKIAGIEQYEIPPMQRDNVVSHLRVAANALDKEVVGEKEFVDPISPIPPKSPPISPVHMSNSPKVSQDGARDSRPIGEIGEIGEIENQSSLLNEKIEDSERNTKFTKSQKVTHISGASTISDPTPQIPSPNPDGTITYQRLLAGKIGTTVIRFEKQVLAKEWRELIYLTFGYSGVIAKIDKPTDRFKWKIVFDEFDKQAIERIERKDLSKTPPVRE
jgi:putative DNA primase/helicase